MSLLFLPGLLLGTALLTTPAPAGDGDAVQRVEGEQAEKIARLCTEALAKSDKAPPVKVAPEVKRSLGLKARKAAAHVVPDAKLTAKALEQADKAVVPVGILFTHRITVVPVDEPISAAKHRTVDVTVGNNTTQINVMYLAVTKVAGRLVLLAYTDANTPALVTTLAEVENAKDLPLDLEARPVKDDRALLYVTILGRYRAAILIAGQE